MRSAVALLVCIGIGYIAEIYFQNPQKYVVWGGIAFITFSGYLYLTQLTSFAFALPIAVVAIGLASILAYTESEPGFILFGVYGAMGVLIFVGGRFTTWTWADWKSPGKLVRWLAGPDRNQ